MLPARLTDHGIVTAWRLLTRLPAPNSQNTVSPAQVMAASPYWPLIGAIIGLCCSGIILICIDIGLGGDIAVGLGLAGTALITGGLHEDGLADCFDALAAGGPAQHRLEILRDPRIGSAGALALMLALLAKFTALTLLADSLTPVALCLILCGVHAGARSMMVLPILVMTPARKDGLASSRPGPVRLIVSICFGSAIFLATFGYPSTIIAVTAWPLVFGFTLCLASMAWVGWVICRKFGGYTGDILGCVEQMGEVALLCLTIIAISAPARVANFIGYLGYV